ncbi:SDR family NAD(P)-dependent oxidoreductase [Kineococcus auxinigenes]|uniref:SDR family NAD(P)-dependent oxidoreductase n=1 Tax=unclassified Kineococcus TaxID=2621656 RepID=UPI003D7E9A85
MDLRLAGRAVLVTGGASGIGAAVVRALRSEGARALALDLAGGADVRADVTDEEQVARAVGQAVGELGGLDGLVCCAGVSGPVGIGAADVALADFERVTAVNTVGAFLTVKHAAAPLSAGRDPAVVLLASDSAFTAAPGMVPYCTSKGAVLALGRSLSVDLAGAGVRVNSVCPSIVDTPMSRTDLQAPQGFGEAPYPVQAPEEVAHLVLFLLSPLARAVNGTHLLADFGASATSSFPA